MSNLVHLTKKPRSGATARLPEAISLNITVESTDGAVETLTQVQVAAELGLAVLAKSTPSNRDEVLEAVRDILRALAATV